MTEALTNRPRRADAACNPDLDLTIDSFVVYAGHGIGRVASRRATKAAGGSRRLVVVEFAHGLSVTLPIERALVCLRPVAGKLELAQVRHALRSREAPSETSWQQRTKTTRTKLADGGTVGFAEVVHDSTRRLRRLSDGQTLSSLERELYLKGRRLLTAEVAAATQSDEAAATLGSRPSSVGQTEGDRPRRSAAGARLRNRRTLMGSALRGLEKRAREQALT